MEEIDNSGLLEATQAGPFYIFKGSNFFRQRIILSVLSGKPIKIIDIRSDSSENLGLQGYLI